MRYLGLVLLLGLAACGGRSADLPVQPPAAQAGEWDAFPVGKKPRPIVLIGELPGMAGFTTGDAKVAASAKNFTLETALPAETPPGMISAKQAYESLTRDPKPDRSAPPLPITSVELGGAPFGTDRGLVSLPAWLFHVKDGLGPIVWPADDPAKFWRLGQVRFGGGGEAKVNGTKLTVTMPAPPPPCPGEVPIHYEPTVVETATVVKVGLKMPSPGDMGDCVRTQPLLMASYDITLQSLLGDRVLLSGPVLLGQDNTVIAVTLA